MAAVQITEYTDPGCPFAFSAEPIRWRLKWLYGDQLEWHLRMVVLRESVEDYAEKGLTAEILAGGQRPAGARARNADGHARQAAPVGDGARLPGRRGGTDARPGARVAAAAPAARAQLRGRSCSTSRRRSPTRPWTSGSTRSSSRPGWTRRISPRTRPRRATRRRPRSPRPHKLANVGGRDAVHVPVLRVRGLSVPGFQPWAAYEVALANVAPGLERRDPPSDVTELLRWAGTPLASKEVAVVMETDVFTRARGARPRRRRAPRRRRRLLVAHGLTPRMRVAICFAARFVCSASVAFVAPGRERERDRRDRLSRVVEHRGRDAREARRDVPVLLGVAVGPRRVQDACAAASARWGRRRCGARARCGSGNSASSWDAGSAASIARPLAVRCAGSRTPTSVTRSGRFGARSSIT